jgi:hypothetical protein
MQARRILREMYARYKKTQLAKGYEVVTREKYSAILAKFGKLVEEDLISGKDVRLYGKIPMIGIRKYRKMFYKRFEPSEGKVVIYPNTVAKFWWWTLYWNKNMRGIKFKGWRFTPTASFRRKMTRLMLQKDGHKKFVVRSIKRVYVEPKTPDYEL